MAIFIDSFPQRSEEWAKARCGNPGASSISEIITGGGQISKSREGYLYKLAGELITGKSEEGFTSQAMQNGIDREDQARALFEMVYDVEVRQVGIAYKDEWKLYHVSPDGLLPGAALEIKCPTLKVAVKYLLDGKLPADYFGQCQMTLHVCEMDLLYFVSYYPGLPPFILEVRRDEPYIIKMEAALYEFCSELRTMVERLRAIQ